MPFKQLCACGKTLLLKEEFAGRKVRCPNCKETMVASAPEEARAEEVPELDVEEVAVTATPPLVTPAPASFEFEEDRPRSRPKRRDEEEDEGEDDDRPRRKSRSRDEDEEEDDDRPRRRKRRDEDDDDDPRSKRLPPAPEINNTTPLATIGVGILMMFGAVVWFVGGLFFDYIFFYPPILFILGIVAVVRGAMQKE